MIEGIQIYTPLALILIIIFIMFWCLFKENKNYVEDGAENKELKNE